VATPTSLRRCGRLRWAWLLGWSALACGFALTLLFAGAAPALGEGAPADPASLLESQREKLKAQQEQRDREFRSLMEEGRALLAHRAYDQAKRVLARAARLKPEDADCQRLLAQAEAASPAPASPEQLLKQTKDEQNGKNAHLHVQLESSLFEAGEALKAGDHARAIARAERVLDSVGVLSDAERAARLRAGADAILTAARAAGEKARSAELAAVRSAHKERAAQDNAAAVEGLRRQGWARYDTGDAEGALAAAEEMLRLDPGNDKARWLRQEAQRLADSRNDVASLRSQRREGEGKLLKDQVDSEFKDVANAKAKIILPANKGRARDYSSRGEHALEAWEQQYRAKLRQPVECELRNATIAEACRYLSEASGCTMVVDPKAAEKTERVNFAKMNLSLEHWLNWVTRVTKTSYTLRDHAILITAPGGLLDQPVTKNYDVSSLLIPIRCIRTTFSGGTQNDEQSWTNREVVGSARPVARQEETKLVAEDVLGEDLARLIRGTVAPETWEDARKEDVLQARQPYTISYRNGRIVVVHVPEVQDQIERLLNDFRKARNLQVHIFARFLVIQNDFLERFNLDLVGPDFDLATNDLGLGVTTLTPPQTPGSTWGFLSEPADPFQLGVNPPRRSTIGYLFNDSRVSVGGEGELSASGPLQIRLHHLGGNEVNALFDAVVKRRKGTILSAPRLTCFNTQRANFQAITNFNYIRSINSDGEPEIGNVPDGIIFDVQPFVSSDRRYITVVLQPQMRTLRNRATLQSGGFQYATSLTIARQVNLPDTELRSLATTVTIPDGGSMLVGGLSVVRERSAEAGVPFLNSIPLLRAIFREWTTFDSRQSLLILVTAELVPDIFEE